MDADKPRLKYANRYQGEFRSEPIDVLLPDDHPVRDVWKFVESLDLSQLLAQVRSVPGKAGAPATDRRILVALWLYATTQGVGSSRTLAELGKLHLAYQWILGGVEVEYHTLSNFRTAHGDALDQLLTQSVAVLYHKGVVDLHRVAQDGMRVRAAAGASSFRREKSMDECLQEARKQVATLRSQADEDAGAASRRERAAQERAATERVERLEAAKVELAKLQKANEDLGSNSKAKNRKKDPQEMRASTTDPECRKMKMSDGGYRPGFNVQFAATTDTGVIVGVDVTNEGADSRQLPPMLDQIESRFGRRPEEGLVDGGFVTVEAIDEAERKGTKVYAPPKQEREQLEKGKDPYARKPSDTDATADWRARMGTPEAKEIYKERASTAELVNAHARNRGLYRVHVRGRQKVLAIVLWYALAHNLTCWRRLRSEKSRTE